MQTKFSKCVLTIISKLWLQPPLAVLRDGKKKCFKILYFGQTSLLQNLTSMNSGNRGFPDCTESQDAM